MFQQFLTKYFLSVEVDYEESGNCGAEAAPQSNMVLRKRIRRIRAGMKKYNTQLDEVKRWVEECFLLNE